MDPHPIPAELAGDDVLQSALASIPNVSVIVFDTEMRIRALHGTALQRHGYVHERMLGQRMRSVMPVPLWQRLEPLYARALAGETVTFEQASLDGKVVYESTVSPVVRDGRVLAGTMTSRDVTAQKAAEADLAEANAQFAEANAQFQAILDHSPIAIFLRDREQRWIVTNAEACGFIGRSAEELVGRSLADTLAPDIAEQMASHDREVMRTGEAASFDESAPDARTGETRHFWSQKFPVRDSAGQIVAVGGVSLDVTERERAARELAAARALFKTAFESAPVGMLVSRAYSDGTVDVIECNPAFASMLGREPSELVGRIGPSIIHPDDLTIRQRMLDDVLAGRPASGELRFKHRDGHDIWALAVPSMTLGPEGERLIVLQAVDISERKRLESELQHLADRDSLTGLFSRRRFQEELEREVSRARRHGRPGALLLLDLDGFKLVNDSFGHAAGDELLTRIGNALRNILRDSDVLARIGGDEFALILPDTDLAAGRVVAEKLIDAVREYGAVTREDRRASVTVSIGITPVSGGPALDSAKLLIEADLAMYHAKESGKDRIAIYLGDGAVAA
jgi:diguanylate cyclase (GGDEF)-like protein/PAS domain S-box-containing protein